MITKKYLTFFMLIIVYINPCYATKNNFIDNISQNNTWIQINKGMTIGDGVIVFSSLDDNLYGAAGYMVYRSNNTGNSWIESNKGLPSPHLLELRSLHSDGENLYIGTRLVGMYKSSDKGDTWEMLNKYNGVSSFLSVGNALFIGIASSGSGGVAKSTDGGVTWKKTGLSEVYVTSLCAHNDKIFAMVSNKGLYVSDDNGDTWKFLIDISINANTLYSYGKTLYAGNNILGVYKSEDDGKTWAASNKGLPESPWITCITSSNGKLLVGMMNYKGVYVSNDVGEHWTDDGLENNYMTVLYAFEDYFYAGCESVFRQNNTRKGG